MKKKNRPIDLTNESYMLPKRKRDLRLLYGTLPGRMILKMLTDPRVSQAAGRYLDSPASRRFIPSFIHKNAIDMEETEEREYNSFNDFFTRRLKSGARKIEMDPQALISPCDAGLTVYPIDGDAVFRIKSSSYTINELVQNEKAAERYQGGYCAIFRLTVGDYHRYCYFDNGTKTSNRFIPGKLHTVNPIAGEHYKIYKTNSREYTILHTENFGEVIQMEIGAMLVGKICNFHQQHSFFRGEEKGKFEFGGSTIALMFRKDTVRFEDKLLFLSSEGYEKRVKMGERIGERF